MIEAIWQNGPPALAVSPTMGRLIGLLWSSINPELVNGFALTTWACGLQAGASYSTIQVCSICSFGPHQLLLFHEGERKCHTIKTAHVFFTWELHSI